ncbi:hypothetical protein ACH4FX_41375 [Streptomyces sp. NPDC018019]|uniref:hypothetical protein n=1 Tax=Streptomyces sp. NPDC018019 TaxID=3365030 RepID=UPI00379ECF7E
MARRRRPPRSPARGTGLVAVLGVFAGAVLALLSVAPSAEAFGTVPGREHSSITRAALGCPQSGTGRDYCFDPRSLTVLAGGGGPVDNPDFWGAVGWPDNLVKPGGADGPEAHCDNADYLDPSHNGGRAYPLTRDQATSALLACVRHARQGFTSAIDSAADLLDVNNRLKTGPEFDRAKRAVLYNWGRLLHAVQDFYSHSNWADAPAPNLPLGTANPPGLNMPRPAQLFNFLAPEPSPASVPRDLTTGCYYLDPDHPNRCQGHVRHGAPLNGEDTGLNKDGGKIDPRTGQTSEPSTYRGQTGRNFDQAVRAAITDTRLQWVDLRQGLENRYAKPGQAWLMACALLRDAPHTECVPGRAPAPAGARATAQGSPVDGGAAPDCGVHWQQPGGPYTTVFMQYVNCSSSPQTMAPYATGAAGSPDSRYTFGRVCRTIAPGWVTSWVIDPSYFPPENTTLQTVTHCWTPTAAAASPSSRLLAASSAGPGAWIGPPPGSSRPEGEGRRAAAPPCGTSWSQPGGTGTTVFIDYVNCLGVPALITPLAIGDGPDSRYSYTGAAQYVAPGGTTAHFRVTPPQFPPEPTNLQWVTRVL